LFKSSNLKSNLSEEGINNWKHVSKYLKTHETSSDHFKSSKKLLLAERNASGIGSQLQQLLSEEKRWRAVFGRLRAVVLFLFSVQRNIR
jgi:hypothetical protein